MSMFWDNVKERLEYLGMTQKELAAITGLNIGTIKNQIYKGVIPDTESAMKLAKALNTSIEFLLTGKDSKNIVLTPLETKLLELFRRIPDDPHRELVISLEEKLLVI